MAQLTDLDLVHEERRRERLRSTVPTLVSLALLLGVAVAGALALRRLVDFGAFMLAGV